MGQSRAPSPIKAPGVSRGIAHRRTRNPVADAQGFYGFAGTGSTGSAAWLLSRTVTVIAPSTGIVF